MIILSSSALKTKAGIYFEVLINIFQSTRHHTPEDQNLQIWCTFSCSSELCSATFIYWSLPICLTCTPISLLTPSIARSCARIGIRSTSARLLCTHAHMAEHTPDLTSEFSHSRHPSPILLWPDKEELHWRNLSCLATENHLASSTNWEWRVSFGWYKEVFCFQPDLISCDVLCLSRNEGK